MSPSASILLLMNWPVLLNVVLRAAKSELLSLYMHNTGVVTKLTGPVTEEPIVRSTVSPAFFTRLS